MKKIYNLYAVKRVLLQNTFQCFKPVGEAYAAFYARQRNATRVLAISYASVRPSV